ncbi:four helix bundle protein [Flagellimonas sp. 2504JD4-2]
MYTYSFEKLDVWKESKILTVEIYEITSSFPDDEKFRLISQLRRGAVCICSNIAEGSSRKTSKDKARFTTISFGSAVEVLNQLILSYELKLISLDNYRKLRIKLESITNKLNALRNFQNSNLKK